MRRWCRQGPCATCLAEDHQADESHSTLHFGSSIACIPNYAEQELVGVMAREAYRLGLEQLTRRTK